MPELKCQVAIIGAGPGGYVCAIRASQLGLDTIIIDAGPVGGTCLNVGCVPSKALIHAADVFHEMQENASGSAIGISATKPKIDVGQTVAWKDGIVTRLTGGVSGLLKKAKTRQMKGHARFVDGKTLLVDGPSGAQTIRADHVVIATGSAPIELPNLPFGKNILSSTEALSLSEIPKRLAVVGGGYIGLEIGTAFAKLGSKVTIVEAGTSILPQYDGELTKPVADRLKALGISLLTNTLAEGLSDNGKALCVKSADGEVKEVPADAVLVTVGRKPLTTGWGLEELQLKMQGGFVDIDALCRTSMRGVYAIGDITGEPMLAHRAMAQGEMVAEIISGEKREWNKKCIPAVCFTDPEIVTVGLLPREAEAKGMVVESASFPFKANARAMSMERDDGFVRMVCRKDNGVIVGVQAVGKGVAELSAGFALAIEMGARAEDVASTIHAHPTQSEAFQEAALKWLGHALHI